jgi:hypothetical protein
LSIFCQGCVKDWLRHFARSIDNRTVVSWKVQNALPFCQCCHGSPGDQLHFEHPVCVSQCHHSSTSIRTSGNQNAAVHSLPHVGGNQFSSGAEKRRTTDDKGSVRFDANTTNYGTSSAYYFIDRYNLDDPYPVGFGGATVPGPSGAYDALSNGTDQVIVLRDTKTLGASMVNEAHFSYTRLKNTLGVPKGGVGVSLADQGISTGPQGI